MFLLVSVRHVGAHPDGHQHGVSIQNSINLGKTFLRISRIRNIPLTWNLARVFAYIPPFISQILGFIYWTVLILILIYFEWRDIENQPLIDLLTYYVILGPHTLLTLIIIKILCVFFSLLFSVIQNWKRLFHHVLNIFTWVSWFLF